MVRPVSAGTNAQNSTFMTTTKSKTVVLWTYEVPVMTVNLTSQCGLNGRRNKPPPLSGVRVSGDRQTNKQTNRQTGHRHCGGGFITATEVP